MGMLRQTEACILTLFWRFVQPFFAFVPLLVDSLRRLAWDSSFIPWPLAPIVTGRAFLLTSYNQIFIHSNSNFSLLVLDWFRESQRTLTAPPTLGVPTLLRPTPNPCEWIHVYDYDGASRRSVSATTALITFAGVPSELRSCWRSSSFILWGSPLCWPDCCICSLLHFGSSDNQTGVETQPILLLTFYENSTWLWHNKDATFPQKWCIR